MSWETIAMEAATVLVSMLAGLPVVRKSIAAAVVREMGPAIEAEVGPLRARVDALEKVVHGVTPGTYQGGESSV